MKCPVCADTVAHDIFPGGASTTDRKFDAFYDKDDKYHRHDKSTTTTFFKCSEGHIWSVEDHFGECDCGWRASSQISSKVTLHNQNRDIDMGEECHASG